MPSADATSPPPNIFAKGITVCFSTNRALALVIVSARIWFWQTQDNRSLVNAGLLGWTTGSNPILQASAQYWTIFENTSAR